MEYPFKNIVIDGNGSKIISFSGTLIELEARRILQNINKFAGVSYGSIIAICLAVGYTGNEMSEILLNTNFNKFLDDKMIIHKMDNSYGLCQGITALNFIKEKIKNKLKNDKLTFQQLYDITGNELVFVVTDITDNRIVYLSRHTTPDMEIALGTRASMSIPFIYCPVKYKNHYLCDGGIGMNFPIQIFDGQFPQNMDNIYSAINKETLALKILNQEVADNVISAVDKSVTCTGTPSLIKSTKEATDNIRYGVHHIFHYSVSIISHMLKRTELLSIKTGHWGRIFNVPSNVKSIGNLSKDEKIISKNISRKQSIIELDYFYKYKKFNNLFRYNIKYNINSPFKIKCKF